ncbi:MAG: hypothetical protein ACR2IK_00720 [Chloroflexota bacterium]
MTTDEPRRGREPAHGWCSLRLRFDQRELALLRAAEQVRGASLAHTPRPDDLRTGLRLAKAAHKVTSAAPGASVSLDENQVILLVAALRYTIEEVRGAPRSQGSRQREVVSAAFPELVELGGWRTFGLTRELEALAARLHTALSA